ncbi:glycoside hydrolase family 97 protein [Phaeodactylibacter xiamenensis]|uniref:glycoside hydrolase family 97 protein n=1 Tax=Phaeodactylibacter xiamenensis TaxID=1524460 RepID=UPI0024A82EC9|nr:glycoside hydrolase family 97 protein [Phaeodactylibacter xiamenensis]
MDKILEISSPGGDLQLQFTLTEEGEPVYWARYKDTAILDTSALGFELVDAPSLRAGFEMTDYSTRALNDVWEMPWGEQREVSNNYNELTVEVREIPPPNRRMRLIFRIYDDGFGFRYEFPEQEGLETLEIAEERTEFQLTGNHTAWWIPGDWDIYEHLYNETSVSGIDALSKRDHPNLAQTAIPVNAVNTPVTMRTANGLHLSFHEAALTDYSGMTLLVDNDTYKLTSNLVGSERTPYKVKRKLPFHTPWRTVQVSPDAAGLIESNLIVNLNEPNQLGDVEWFKPTKYVGIWWEMHLGKSSWDMASGKHGATTENAKRYIDFAAENNIGAVLVEGWNTGWEHWIGFEDREGVFDFVTPYEDYDLEEVVRYANEKGVEMIMHHETSAAPRTYEQQLDTAYALMQRLGIHSVKTGYVGKIIPAGEYHHGQWMVNHYRKVLETAAEYEVAVNAHEPIKATGIRRTFPNAISREGLRGQEFNAWSVEGGNPPDHLPTVAFTRMLAGPIDFTPGIFNMKLAPYKEESQINTTLAHQLALYVVIYSPVQMAADLPEHYEDHPAFEFIREVGVDWEQSKVLNGEVGDYVTIARQERGTDRWFLGSITDEQERSLEASLDFLPAGANYKATIYRDGEGAHWDENPSAFLIESFLVDRSTTLKLDLAPGGGTAVTLEPATAEDEERLQTYR